jgi:CRISP-associated protein Cas1
MRASLTRGLRQTLSLGAALVPSLTVALETKCRKDTVISLGHGKRPLYRDRRAKEANLSTHSLPFTTEQLWEAWERVRENAGCAGSDGITVEKFAQRAASRIPALFDRVAQNQYRPFPLLKIAIDKKPAASGTRTLLVPTVADRILQTAVARHLSHSFEEEFLECSYGYRPGRSVDRAIARIRKCHELGFCNVVDADISSYFDEVEHRILLHKLASRNLGQHIEALLRVWVKAQVWDGSHVYPLRTGVPQGSPISPLLANFYLEDFDQELEKSGRKLVRYADDFLILTRSADDAHAALLQTETLLAAEHLAINEEKTRIVTFDQGFRFLGALFLGDATWVPWKHEHRHGRLLFMAPPLPAALRARYETAPPKTAMEAALTRVELIPSPKNDEKGSDPVAFLYLTEQGSILRKAGDRLLVEKEDELLLDVPYHKLENVMLFGNVQVTSQAMGELLEKGVNLSLFSRQGMYRGALAPPRGKNVDLRIAQFEAFRNAAFALDAARAIVSAKVGNGAAVLKVYRRHNTKDEAFDRALEGLATSAGGATEAHDIASLDGIEGAAAREYFTLLMHFNLSEMSWPGRVKHPATDPLNALLSLTYTLIMNELSGLLEAAGLDPYLGFLHQIDYGRPSLALDLMEPFRHPVADRLVLTLVNRRVLDSSDFSSGGEGHGVFLTPKAMKRYFAEYERWMLARVKDQTSFRECLRTEVEGLCAALRNQSAFAPWRYREEPEEDAQQCSTSSATT